MKKNYFNHINEDIESNLFDSNIHALKKGEELMPQYHPDNANYKFKFCLSPLDMVYMPTKEEIKEGIILDKKIDISRIYVVNNFEGSKVYFRPYYHAAPIIEKEVDLRLNEKGKPCGSFSDKTANCQGMLIRDYCIPIKTDRRGNMLR